MSLLNETYNSFFPEQIPTAAFYVLLGTGSEAHAAQTKQTQKKNATRHTGTELSTDKFILYGTTRKQYITKSAKCSPKGSPKCVPVYAFLSHLSNKARSP